MIVENAVNHGGHSEHGENQKHFPLGDYEEWPKTQASRRVRRGYLRLFG
jgi:hypothetical protein